MSIRNKKNIHRKSFSSKTRVAPMSPPSSENYFNQLNSKHCPTGVDEMINSILTTPSSITGRNNSQSFKLNSKPVLKTEDAKIENHLPSNDLQEVIEPIELKSSSSDNKPGNQNSSSKKYQSFRKPSFKSLNSKTSGRYSQMSIKEDEYVKEVENEDDDDVSKEEIISENNSDNFSSTLENVQILDEVDSSNPNSPKFVNSPERNTTESNLMKPAVHPLTKTFSKELRMFTYTSFQDDDNDEDDQADDNVLDNNEKVSLSRSSSSSSLQTNELNNNDEIVIKKITKKGLFPFIQSNEEDDDDNNDDDDMKDGGIVKSPGFSSKSKLFPSISSPTPSSSSVSPISKINHISSPPNMSHLQSQAKLALGSMNMSNSSSENARNRWTKIKNFSLAVRAFSEPLRNENNNYTNKKTSDNKLSSIQQINQDLHLEKEANSQFLKNIHSSMPALMHRDASLEEHYAKQHSQLDTHHDDYNDNNDNGKIGQFIINNNINSELMGDEIYLDHEMEEKRKLEEEEKSRLSLPQLLGGAQTSNEASIRWRKLRTMARVLKAFDDSSKKGAILRRRSLLTSSEVKKEKIKEFKLLHPNDSEVMEEDDDDDDNDDDNDGGKRGTDDSSHTLISSDSDVDSEFGDFASPKKKTSKNKNINSSKNNTRRSSAPSAMEQKIKLTKSVLSLWMDVGGKRQRNTQKAKRKAATEKHFKGLPWRCTVCEKRHYASVELMSSSRCAACGAERDAIVTPVQHWRESIEVGDWVETKRYHRSAHYLAKVEHIRVATKDTLSEALRAAQARAMVPSNNLRTFKGLMHAIVTMTFNDTIQDVFNQQGGDGSSQYGGGGGGSQYGGSTARRRSSFGRRSSQVTSNTGGGGGTESVTSSHQQQSKRRPSNAGSIVSASSMDSCGSNGGGGSKNSRGRRRSSFIKKRRRKRNLIPWQEADRIVPDFDFLPSADPFGPSAMLYTVQTVHGEHLDVPRWWLQPPQAIIPTTIPAPVSPAPKPLGRTPFVFPDFSSSSAATDAETVAPTPPKEFVVERRASITPKRRMSRSSSMRTVTPPTLNLTSLNRPSSRGGGVGGGVDGKPQSARRRRSSTNMSMLLNSNNSMNDDSSTGSGGSKSHKNTVSSSKLSTINQSLDIDNSKINSRPLKEGDHVLARSKAGHIWLKAQVHKMHLDGTISCRYCNSGILEVGLFPSLVKLDKKHASNQSDDDKWTHPCVGCGKKNNLIIDSICIVCKKPRGYRTPKALQLYKKVSQMEIMHRRQPDLEKERVAKEKYKEIKMKEAQLLQKEKYANMKIKPKLPANLVKSKSLVAPKRGIGRVLSHISSADGSIDITHSVDAVGYSGKETKNEHLASILSPSSSSSSSSQPLSNFSKMFQQLPSNQDNNNETNENNNENDQSLTSMPSMRSFLLQKDISLREGDEGEESSPMGNPFNNFTNTSDHGSSITIKSESGEKEAKDKSSGGGELLNIRVDSSCSVDVPLASPLRRKSQSFQEYMLTSPSSSTHSSPVKKPMPSSDHQTNGENSIPVLVLPDVALTSTSMGNNHQNIETNNEEIKTKMNDDLLSLPNI